MSVVTDFMDAIYENSCSGTGHSWERFNTALKKGVMLAIGAGFAWEIDDFKTLASRKWWRYCAGESSENMYTKAIIEGNMTAAQSYESWQEREPFIADGVRMPDYVGGTYAHMVGDRIKERLAVGFHFRWKGKNVTVTSFNGESLTACSYKPRPEGSSERKVEKRFTIGRDDIIADRAERKKRAEYMKELSEPGKWKRPAEAILKLLGITKKDDYETMPLKKLESVLAQLKTEVVA